MASLLLSPYSYVADAPNQFKFKPRLRCLVLTPHTLYNFNVWISERSHWREIFKPWSFIVKPCFDVLGYQRFGDPCCVYLQGEVSGHTYRTRRTWGGNLYASTITRVIKSRMMRWAEYIACTRKLKISYWTECKRKRPLGRPTHRYNTRIDLTEIAC
jgi:hypothetical protein